MHAEDRVMALNVGKTILVLTAVMVVLIFISKAIA